MPRWSRAAVLALLLAAVGCSGKPSSSNSPPTGEKTRAGRGEAAPSPKAPPP
jgi:hypothetical protein